MSDDVEIEEGHPIWEAIDRGGGQTVNIKGVLRELGKIGYALIEPGQLKQLKIDAARWCALMSSERMHFMGSAGFHLQAKEGMNGRMTRDCVATPRPGEDWHFGMEFWSKHPAHGDPKYPDEFERQLLIAYVDAMRGKLGG